MLAGATPAAHPKDAIAIVAAGLLLTKALCAGLAPERHTTARVAPVAPAGQVNRAWSASIFANSEVGAEGDGSTIVSVRTGPADALVTPIRIDTPESCPTTMSPFFVQVPALSAYRDLVATTETVSGWIVKIALAATPVVMTSPASSADGRARFVVLSGVCGCSGKPVLRTGSRRRMPT